MPSRNLEDGNQPIRKFHRVFNEIKILHQLVEERFASLRSGVSSPSVKHPLTGARRSTAFWRLQPPRADLDPSAYSSHY